jgi:hypothetical protein
MRQYQPPDPIGDAREMLVARLSEAASSALKQLLEARHLYQKVSIPADSIIKEVRATTLDARLLFDRAVEPFLKNFRFMLSNAIVRTADDETVTTYPTLVVSNVKIFCSHCHSREAFAPIWYRDLVNDLAKPVARGSGPVFDSLPRGYQLFWLAYQCQVCNRSPEAFMVRRKDWDLFHEGRSPIEFIEIPSFLPKEEREYFRDAVIAHNSGKTLAGLFYLRTFIEQFARRKTAAKGRLTGDQILDNYNKTIPEKQRDEIPSLRDWYEKLSEALHEAKSDEALFDEAKSEIERHFDFRRLYKIN